MIPILDACCGGKMFYFDEDIKFDGKAPQCKVVVSHESLSEEDQERIRRQAQEEIERDAVEQAKKNMQKAAADLDFMAAAKYRDEMWALQQYLKVWKD